MFRSFFAPALAGLLLSTAIPAAAQSIPSPYRYIEEGQEAGLFVGRLSSERGLFGYGPAPGLSLGLRYSVEVSGPFALEGIFTSLPTTRDVMSPGRAEGDRRIGEANVALAAFEARLRFALTGRRTWNGVQPFLVLGGGLAFDAEGTQQADLELQEQDRFDFGTRFTGTIGGGLRYILADRFVIRGDATMSIWKLNVPEGFRDPELGFEDSPESEWANSPGITLGIAYRW